MERGVAIGPGRSSGGGWPAGWLANPGALAAAAAGCAAAALMLWALRGLPLGTLTLWLVPLPLFLAGLGFGGSAAWLGAALAAVLLWMTGGVLPVAVFLVLFGLPVPLLVTTALRRRGPMDLTLPLALVGLWPLAVLLVVAATLPGEVTLEASMRGVVEAALTRLGAPAPEEFVAALARVKAAAIAFCAAVAWLATGRAAQGFLARRGLARAATPDFAALRLPFWYPALPALAAGMFLAAPAEGDAMALSALLMLLVPLFFAGIAGVHRRLRGRGGRLPMLAAFYVLLVLFLQFMGPALVGLGLHDQLRRRAPGQT